MSEPITHIDDVREKLVDAVLVTCAVLMVPFAILSKSAFMANVFHEFRAPLNAIVGYAEIHQKDEDGSDRLAEDMGRIAVSGRALSNLVESILELSRFEAGDQRPEPVPLDMETFFASHLPIYERQASEKGLSLTWNVAEDVPKGVMLDEVRVGKALGHLVDNASSSPKPGRLPSRHPPHTSGMTPWILFSL